MMKLNRRAMLQLSAAGATLAIVVTFVPLGLSLVASTNPSSWSIIGIGTFWAFALAFLGKWFGYFLVAYWLRLDLPALLPWLPLGEGLLSLAFFWPLRPKAQEEPKA